MTKRKIIIIIAILFVILGIALYPLLNRKTATAPTKQSNDPIVTESQNTSDLPRVSIIATGFEVPWALAFLPDNSLLVTERPGRVRMITKEGNLLPEPLLTLTVVQKIQGEGGLHGIAPHPDFESNRFVYLYYTYETNGQASRNRVARYTLENNKLINETIVVDDIPGALFHDGGRIKFGPDKLLYITTGDAQEPSLAQDSNSLAGKTLRVTPDGQPAPGNSFGSRVFSYGHRNSQGLAWDKDGKLWQTEHGRSNPTGFDEINLVENGKNYGWEIIQGDETRAGMETPKYHSGENGTWAPAGAAFVGDSFFFAGLRGRTIYEAVIANNDVVELKEHFNGEFGRFREVVTGPDGMLYITTSNRDGRGFPAGDDDRILRVNPAKL